MKSLMMKFWRDEQGLTAVEYAVAGALVIGGLVAIFTALGGQIGVRIQALTAAIT
ncbi:MAG: Flp family type IVb pilin [Steroidobacteraceae bacterium]